MTEATDVVRDALARMGLANATADYPMTPLGGGVSCDVYLIDLPGRRICVKRALSKLRVMADWHAPPERSEAEVAWLRLVADIDPKLVPKILGEDRQTHIFAMEYLPPEHFTLWKSLLAGGEIDTAFAASVGAALARIHAATAGREDIAAAFDNGAQFHALRIEPYLLYTAGRNPDVADAIRGAADSVATSRIALMQGDVSPKNILKGPDGPVFLDAETACYGDPAFDLAFCLNHLLLKGAWHPQFAGALAGAFLAFKLEYFRNAVWEPPQQLERRTTKLLPALLLARVDGKSPVEYLTDERSKEFVRTVAKALLKSRDLTLDETIDRWTAALRSM